MWPFRKKRSEVPQETNPAEYAQRGTFSTDVQPRVGPSAAEQFDARRRELTDLLPKRAAVPGAAMDASDTGTPIFKRGFAANIPDALLFWYGAQGFIGYHTCAMVSQHWLVDKACTIPARDAIRQGFSLQLYGVEDDQKDEVDEQIKRADKRYRLNARMQEFIRLGRVFGIRVAFFEVETSDPTYYEKPFNIDAVKPGSYRGISQIDPYWCVPMLSEDSATDPASQHFYEPEWWIINGRRYHRTHLCIFRNAEVPDLLKPAYMYGGVSVPQKIMERVYASERTANEAPQLAMTKRLDVLNTDLSAFYAKGDAALEHMRLFTEYRDNFGVKLVDTDDTMQRFDTALADLDETIMTQYQLVAAAANVPATKLLGTTPKGFNATGEYEEASYHEELESIQANDLTPFVDRHHALVLRSDVEPALKLAPGSIRCETDWAPLDSPTAKEYAEINKLKADTDAVLVNAGAIDGLDVRSRLRADPDSDYTDLADIEEPIVPGEGEAESILAGLTNGPTQTPPALPDA